jgi:methyl acetate hydrolase
VRFVDAKLPPTSEEAPSGREDFMHSMAAFEKVMKQTIDSDEAPGLVAILSDAHNALYEVAYGRRSVAASDAMTPDTIFWLASMSKAIVSAGAMQLVEQGKVQLDEPVGKFLPALASPQVLQGFADNGAPQLRPAKQPITLRRLLTHTAGFAFDTWNGDMLRYLKENNFSSLLHASATCWSRWSTIPAQVGDMASTLIGLAN